MSTPDWTAQARQIADDAMMPRYAEPLDARDALVNAIAAALAAAYQAGRADGGKPQRVMVRPDVSVEPDNG